MQTDAVLYNGMSLALLLLPLARSDTDSILAFGTVVMTAAALE